MTNRGVGKATELGLFCEVYSFSSKLELDGTRYSTDSWAELVIKDKRYDTKLFAKTKLRLIDGFRLSDYSGLFGTDFRVDFAAVLPQLLKDGLLEQNGEILRFTQKGLDNTNPVMGSLIEALEKPETVI